MAHADLAARVQRDLETALCARFARYRDPQRDVVFTGGIALNSVANRRIAQDIKPNRAYFLPAQYDAGIALGAAAAALFAKTGHTNSGLFRSDFLGYRYLMRDVEIALNQFAGKITFQKIDHDELAERISKGEIFGFFSLAKGSEFGPRALGARSILADPRQRETWEFINRWIKYREDFRPFAPMICRESLSTFFDADEDLPYMLQVVPVKREWRGRLEAITHVDGSARVQTVDRNIDPEIHSILRSFEKFTDLPILLNTSFNVRGQPMVETPTHALEMLLSTQLSGVIFGDILVTIPPMGEIGPASKFVLAPGVQLQTIHTQSRVKHFLAAKNQGKTLTISAPVADFLGKLNQGGTLGEVLAALDDGSREESTSKIKRFLTLRFLNELVDLSEKVDG